MRWLINYFRQCFCKHSFVKEEIYYTITNEDNEVKREGTKVSLICSKCGYHKSFWKF